MTVSRTAQLLRYFAQQYKGDGLQGIPRVRLMKMAYLSDLLAREYLSRPVTAFEYYRYEFGPYDEQIIDSIEELVAEGLAEVVTEWGGDRPTKRLVGRGAPLAFEFSEPELEVMKYVADNYIGMDMRELLQEVVYRTQPMVPLIEVDWRKKIPLDMDQMNGQGERAVGFRLADVLRAERAVHAGRFVTSI